MFTSMFTTPARFVLLLSPSANLALEKSLYSSSPSFLLQSQSPRISLQSPRLQEKIGPSPSASFSVRTTTSRPAVVWTDALGPATTTSLQKYYAAGAPPVPTYAAPAPAYAAATTYVTFAAPPTSLQSVARSVHALRRSVPEKKEKSSNDLAQTAPVFHDFGGIKEAATEIKKFHASFKDSVGARFADRYFLTVEVMNFEPYVDQSVPGFLNAKV